MTPAPPAPSGYEYLTRKEADMAFKRRAWTIFEWLGPTDGRTILDCGCGRGFYLKMLRHLGTARLFGVDLELPYLRKARRNTASLSSVLVGNASIYALPFPDETFDAVLLSFALHDMPRRVRGEVLREAARVARDRLVILDYDVPRREPWRRLILKGLGLFETPYLADFARQGGAAGAIAEAGLTVRETVRLMPGLFAVYVVA